MSSPRFFGVYRAAVTQNQDPEQAGVRIKVKLNALNGGEETDWIPVAAPTVGVRSGWYALPDVNDQVVVGFIEGDINSPVVLGGLWTSQALPPETNENGKNVFRGYQSRLGARLIFDDSRGGKVTLATSQANAALSVGEFAGDGAGPHRHHAFVAGGAGAAGVAVAAQQGGLSIVCKSLVVEAGKNVGVHVASDAVTVAGAAISGRGKQVVIGGAGGTYAGKPTYIGKG